MIDEQTTNDTTEHGHDVIRTLQMGDTWFEERPGGLGRVFYELSQNLAKADVSFYGLVLGKQPATKQPNAEIETFASPRQPVIQRLINARSHVRKALKEQSIQVIVSHFALYTFPSLAEIKHLPLVVHFHGPWVAESHLENCRSVKSLFKRHIEMSVYSRAQRLIVLSKAFQQELTRTYGVSEELVRVVPAGVDTDRFNCQLSQSAARDALNWPGERFIIVAVRRLVRRMGLEDLVNAIKSLVKSTPDVLLYIIGVGPIQGDLQMQIDELGLSRWVKLVGRIDDATLPLVYRAADLSVVPSVSLEGFGMITLESLASGTPVMVTPVGGLPEVVYPLSPSLIFEGVGSDALASGIHGVICGSRKMPTQKECRSYTEANFTWPVVAANVAKIYREAIG